MPTARIRSQAAGEGSEGMRELEGRGDSARAVGLNDTLDRILREVEGSPEGERAPAADDRPPPSPPHAEGGDRTHDEAIAAAGDGGVPLTGGTPLGALLGGLAGNPALLSAIPALMENLGPLLGGGGGKSGGGGKGGGGKSIAPSLDRHTALLCAVKPYLGGERQEAAEKIIRLCRAWDALQKSGMTEILRATSHTSAPQKADGAGGKGGEGGYV